MRCKYALLPLEALEIISLLAVVTNTQQLTWSCLWLSNIVIFVLLIVQWKRPLTTKNVTASQQSSEPIQLTHHCPMHRQPVWNIPTLKEDAGLG